MRVAALAFMLPAVGAVSLSPVTRVAELLENLSAQVTKAGKTEAKLYKKYRCWIKQTTKEKNESNAEANARIETLAAYIDDIENGRIEFTTERVDLEKQLANINAQLEKAKQIREQENQDFNAASEEMKKGITALDGAIQGLTDATSGSFLARKFDVRRALLIGKDSLNKSDFQLLEKALDHQPEGGKDWEKINKKGEFKDKYGKRSGDIQGTLNGLLQTFKDNLAAAEDKEAKALASYEKLKGAKEAEKEATQTALTEMKGENAARNLSKGEASEEKKQLEDQVAADTKFLAEATAEFDEKTKEYQARKSVRAEEVAAISQAIGILRSDDARDLFKKSYDSQTNFFQLATSSNAKDRSVAQIQSTLRKFQHEQKFRLYMLKVKKSDSSIAEVITAIDEMIQTLKDEKEEDLKKKTDCENQFRTLMQDMKKDSLAIDDEQEIIETKTEEIQAANDKIDEANKKIEAQEKSQKEATQIREDENAEYQQNKTDDKGAVELIVSATEVLANFYKNKSLLQTSKSSQNPVPKFLDGGGYSGEGEEGGSVIAALDMIKADIEKDIAEADAEEEASQKTFDEFIADSQAQVTALQTEITTQEGVIADATTDKTDAQKSKDQIQEELGAKLDEYRQKEGHCNFYMLNFETRNDARKVEQDGLLKAKTILQGGSA